MELKTLTTEEQMKVIEITKFILVKEMVEAEGKTIVSLNDIPVYSGLCDLVKKAINTTSDFPWFEICNSLDKLIPLFNRDNAIQHANASRGGLYWWARVNYKDRLAFLDWMISELEKQLKD